MGSRPLKADARPFGASSGLRTFFGVSQQTRVIGCEMHDFNFVIEWERVMALKFSRHRPYQA